MEARATSLRPTRTVAAIMTTAALCWIGGTTEALTNPSNHLLLPYFELALEQGSQRHLVSVGNHIEEPVDVDVTVWTNWGIPIIEEQVELLPHSIRTLDLSHWLTTGQLPTRTLDPNELAHVHAALSGEPSPVDGLIYSDDSIPGVAVGYVTVRNLSRPATPPLWGEYVTVDSSNGSNEGEPLVALDAVPGCSSLCISHAVAFLNPFKHELESKIIVWNGRARQPVPPEVRWRAVKATDHDPDGDEQPLSDDEIQLHAHSQDGETIGDMRLSVNAAEAISVADIGIVDDSGWVHLDTAVPSYIGVIHGAKGQFSANLRTFCLPEKTTPGTECDDDPSVRIETMTNGEDADAAPGPSIPVGDPVEWTYEITNTGSVWLFGVTVQDNRGAQISCPGTDLAAGASMTCTASGIAEPGQFRTSGTVTALSPAECLASSTDPSHYFGEIQESGDPSIDVEKATNGYDADSPTGPMIPVGDPVTWTYVVTNTGTVDLSNVIVVDDMGVDVSCPTTELAVGEMMNCMGSGTAELGQYANLATVTGTSSEGEQVSDADPSHYYGEETTSCGPCEGKIDSLSIRYLGDSIAFVRVTSKHGPSGVVVFEGSVPPGGTFDLIGPNTPNPGFSGTLGTEITFEIDGTFDTEIHTSCSQPVYPGMTSGSFQVLEGSSSGGGALCPL